jgi:hypothetical protein
VGPLPWFRRGSARPENEKGHAKIRDLGVPHIDSLVQAPRGARSKLGYATMSLAGDPSEVTALAMRHWITSFLL